MEKKSLHYKKILLTTNFSCIIAAMYCYWRYNTYCEPGMYSIFSLFEYTVVLSNIRYKELKLLVDFMYSGRAECRISFNPLYHEQPDTPDLQLRTKFIF